MGALKELGGQSAPTDLRGDFRAVLAELAALPEVGLGGGQTPAYVPGAEKDLLRQLSQLYRGIKGQEKEEEYQEALQRKLNLDRCFMNRNPLALTVVALVVVIIAIQGFFTVFQTQKALVLQLGEPLPRVYGPGLHFKIPFIQNVVYFDARVLDYEARSREAFTVDKKAIVLDNYARWKIIDPLQFYRTMRPYTPTPFWPLPIW